LRIGFDISQTGSNRAGCGYFAHGLITSLAELDSTNEYILYPTFGDNYWDNNWSENIARIAKPNFRLGISHREFRDMQRFWEGGLSGRLEALGNPDIVHANNFFYPRGLNVRIIFTLYDLSFIHHPEYTTEQNRLICFKGVYFASLYSDYIIAISEYSLNHFLQTFPYFPKNRISIVYGGSRFSRQDKIPSPLDIHGLKPGQFWLNVGTLEPRKNHHALLKAYALYKQKHGYTYPLVLAGAKGWLMDDFEKMLQRLGLSEEVVVLGYVDEALLKWLYENCFAFIFPSLFEGFGLPVLEAMTLGSPVIVSSVSSLPEVVGNKALLVDPMKHEEICTAMYRLTSSNEFYEEYKSTLIERAQNFSWQRAGAQLLKIYKRVYELPRRSN
jgi:glycosyltransferase involved in cell wall biosynthesis